MLASRDGCGKEQTASDGVCVERALSARGMYAGKVIGISGSAEENGVTRVHEFHCTRN